MPRRVVRVHQADGDTLRRGIAAIQQEMGVSPDFPAEVEAAATHAAANPKLPELDRTDLPLVTIDPPQSRDLDQAMHLERSGDGYVVYYAIADVAAFVEPGSPVDLEANRRGETLYGADSKVPLHPPVLSEGAASLLPDQDRPALLWTIRVDASGEGTDAFVERALVRSRAKLDYESLQRRVDQGTAGGAGAAGTRSTAGAAADGLGHAPDGLDDLLTLLREVGELRKAREAARGGVSLPLPEQEINVDGENWSLAFRKMLPVEEWNAQISLLTGMAAASLMVYAQVGLLRTLPPPDPRDVQRLHRTARALGIDWPAELLYPDFIRSLDPDRPEHAAMVLACTQLLRGAGYVGFNGAVPAQPEHSALASEYAHVTAPLRRLVDRYALEICVALCAETEVPTWVLDKLDELPRTMAESGRRAGAYESALVNLVEAEVMRKHVGETYAGVVVALDEDQLSGDVVIQEHAIEGKIASPDPSRPLPLGTDLRVRLVEVDLDHRVVRFEPL
ncbi:MAG TPA: RNB domain-containing ribonuclease [Nocardioidaceae bacterium]|nr:RNB domain-containing ribonuclease [Nocardioidaceae bacterium]